VSNARIIKRNPTQNFSVMNSLKFSKILQQVIVFVQNVNTIMKKNINSTLTVIKVPKKIKENCNNV